MSAKANSGHSRSFIGSSRIERALESIGVVGMASLVELDHPEDERRKKAKRHYSYDGDHCGWEFHWKFLSRFP
jgi:hypothetical protein